MVFIVQTKKYRILNVKNFLRQEELINPDKSVKLELGYYSPNLFSKAQLMEN